MAGALDNLFREDADATKIVKQIGDVLNRPSSRNVASLYMSLVDDGAISVVDTAIGLIAKTELDPDRFQTLFEWMVRKAPDREPVKFALAMLGLLAGNKFRDVFLTLGAHEEFTKYAAVALSNALPEDEARAAQFELAKSVDGWGRIDLVERLAPQGGPEFRHWVVRQGYRNTIMDEYLAWTAAHHGRLLNQLQATTAGDDNALLDGAAGIFEALVMGGPAEDIGDYEDALAAVHVWLDLVSQTEATLPRASAARLIMRHAEEDSCKWTDAASKTIADQASAYLARPELRGAVLRDLKSGKNDYWRAKSLAPSLGIDPWPFIFDLQASDSTLNSWFDLMRTDDADRVDQVLALAEVQLPLEKIASGPALEMGLGPEWRVHSALDFIVQSLGAHPGKGWSLVYAALQSPVIRNRNMALRALDAWPREHWPTNAWSALEAAHDMEPDEHVAGRMHDLLRTPNHLI